MHTHAWAGSTTPRTLGASVALAVAVGVTVGVAGCSSGAGSVSVTAAVTTLATASTPVTTPALGGSGTAASSGASSSASTPSVEATSTASASTPTASSSAAPGAGACSASGSKGATLRAGAFPAAVQATAKKMLAAVTACDAPTLVTKTTKDSTILAFDAATPRQSWAVPDTTGRYAAAVTLLTRVAAQREQLGESETEYIWPRVASEKGFGQDSAWKEAVAAGLVAAKDVATMRSSGYTGWHLHIGVDGRILAFVLGQG